MSMYRVSSLTQYDTIHLLQCRLEHFAGLSIRSSVIVDVVLRQNLMVSCRYRAILARSIDWVHISTLASVVDGRPGRWPPLGPSKWDKAVSLIHRLTHLYNPYTKRQSNMHLDQICVSVRSLPRRLYTMKSPSPSRHHPKKKLENIQQTAVSTVFEATRSTSPHPFFYRSDGGAPVDPLNKLNNISDMKHTFYPDSKFPYVY